MMDPLLQKPPSTDLIDPVIDETRFLDYYRILRGQIEHEDNLIGSRISWFVTSQSFLFSAFAIMTSSVPANPTEKFVNTKHTLLVIIPSIGMATSAMILLAIFSGFHAMARIRKRYLRCITHTDDGKLPPIQGTHATRLVGMAAPILLPPLFMAVWIFLLLQRSF